MKESKKIRREDYQIQTDAPPYVFHSNLHRTFASNSEEMNWHESPEIQFCVDGTGKVLIDGTEYEFKKNAVIFVNSDCVHYTYTESTLCYDALIIRTEFFRMLGIDYKHLRFFASVSDSRIHDLLADFKKLEHDAWCVTKRCALLAQIIVLLTENYSAENTEAITEKVQERVKTALKYIHKNYNEKISTEEIAKQTYSSVSLISRDFKKFTGKTIVDYTNHYRCMMAAQMIQEGFSVSEAAFSCGFENLSFFSKTFKRYLGKLPRELKGEHCCSFQEIYPAGFGKIKQQKGDSKMCEAMREFFAPELKEAAERGSENNAMANARSFFQNGASYELVRASIQSLSDEVLQKIYQEVKP